MDNARVRWRVFEAVVLARCGKFLGEEMRVVYWVAYWVASSRR